MSRQSPIYREGEHEYRIDTCQPQIEAWNSGQVNLIALTHGLYPGERMAPHHLPGLSSIGYIESEKPQNWGMNSHRNEGIEISFVEKGSANIRVEDEEIMMRTNDVIITRPWQEHGSGEEGWLPGCVTWLILDVGVRRPNQKWVWPQWIVLSKEDLDALERLLCGSKCPVWRQDKELARWLLDIGIVLEKRMGAASISQLAVLINGLLLAILKRLRGELGEPDPVEVTGRRSVELFLEGLRRHPERTTRGWKLEEMAEECGMSKTALWNYTRELTNESPICFVNRIRLRLAAQALKDDPTLTVTDVAVSVGFSSSQYFSTLFRNRYGSSPLKWRKKQQEGS